MIDRGLEDRRQVRLVQRDEELVVVLGEPVGKERREEELREGQDVDLAASGLLDHGAGARHVGTPVVFVDRSCLCRSQGDHARHKTS